MPRRGGGLLRDGSHSASPNRRLCSSRRGHGGLVPKQAEPRCVVQDALDSLEQRLCAHHVVLEQLQLHLLACLELGLHCIGLGRRAVLQASLRLRCLLRSRLLTLRLHAVAFRRRRAVGILGTRLAGVRLRLLVQGAHQRVHLLSLLTLVHCLASRLELEREQ